MLTLTPAAVEAVNAITAAEDIPNGSGLRIATSDESTQAVLQVELVAGPAEHDQVVSDRGALVFLDPTAASYLDDKVLNAEVDDQGGAYFTLFAQNNDDTTPRERH